MVISTTGKGETHSAGIELDLSRQRLAGWLGDFGTAMLRLLPAETAHEAGMWLLASGLMDRIPAPYVEGLVSGMATTLPGIGVLPHPLGLAAGFDKNCRCPLAFARLGFSFLEVGTVTPQPQPGNPKPRMFRLPQQRAIINRMGFNSDGAATVSARLSRLGWDHDKVPLGINCGKNKDTPPERALRDYMQVIETFREHARFFVVNVSSPNTPGLRDLATPEFVHAIADELGHDLARIWLKIDPDMDRASFQALVHAAADRGLQGLVLSNTHRVVHPEPGGLSGHPLMARSTACLEWAWQVHKGALPMIATGGVLTGLDVLEKIRRGALAVEIYTALVYRGPWAVVKILTELAQEMRLLGVSTVQELTGSYYQ